MASAISVTRPLTRAQPAGGQRSHVMQRAHHVKLTQRARPMGSRRCVAASPRAFAQITLEDGVSLREVAAQLQAAAGPKEKAALLLAAAKSLPPFPEHARDAAHRVMGCTSQVWVHAEAGAGGRLRFWADSDSELTRGLAALLVRALSGMTLVEVLQVRAEDLAALQLGPTVLTPSRANGFLNMLEALRKRARLAAGALSAAAFPSLRVCADRVEPRGAFAEAQAAFLEPDQAQVDALVKVLSEKRIGVVAHFYMDAEVQGVLTSAAERWRHIHISDSLVMADAAVGMAKSGCAAIAVLGVDFMSENVRAILDEAGYNNVDVYRMAASDIGCSLAEAAEAPAYSAYLGEAAASGDPALHVVYINTSLRTKALAHAAVPTITCTSSNVVQTVLQAFAQVPNLNVYYGPDTYMGRNLAAMLRAVAQLPDQDVAALHPAHTAASVRALPPRLHYFEEGACIVHHLFGAEVTELVRAAYGDAYLTAHFEVPGEMFALAMEARQRGMGCVGSTQNILDFIAARLSEALQRPFPDTLQVVLGTESGMVTSIVRRVQGMLREAGRADVALEIVFPVAADAVTRTGGGSGIGAADAKTGNGALGGLALLPGPAGGEGCSAEGGCASCPYMKMNSLDALLGVCAKIGTPGEALLEANKPRQYAELINGRSLASAGCKPILHMRGFQASKQLPPALVADILARATGSERN